MKNKKSLKILGVVLGLAIVIGIAYLISNSYVSNNLDETKITQQASPDGKTSENNSSDVTQPSRTNSAMYSCNAGKSITVLFYEGTSSVSIAPSVTGVSSIDSNQPPTPTGKVNISLSDGRKMTLSQTISADGGRYTNKDESFVFWDKGNNAMVLENGKEKNFTKCFAVFTIVPPTSFTPDISYKYQALGPGKDIYGIKFTIPASIAKGTNLSNDSYVSVEQLPLVQSGGSLCSATPFLNSGSATKPHVVNENGISYSVASSSDAGAGNRYDETVYAVIAPNSAKQCIAVRYFVHYGVFENYPEGTITRFDEGALIKLFDQVRSTLVLSK